MKIQAVELGGDQGVADGAVRAAKGKVQTLLTGDDGAPDNYLVRFSSGQEGGSWTTPRHRHAFDQIRYVIDGSYSIGKNRDLPSGWVGYFPEAVHYGPQDMSPNLRMVVLQFGGPSRLGFYTTAERKAAMAALRSRGRNFHDGICSWVDKDGKHLNQDAGEAMWEEIHGVQIKYPEPRFDGLIVMNPASFGWRQDPAEPGVYRRELGTFTEREVKLGFVRVEPGATLMFGEEPAAEVIILTKGSVSCSGTHHSAMTAFSSAASDPPTELTGVDLAEFFYVKLPTFLPSERN